MGYVIGFAIVLAIILWVVARRQPHDQGGSAPNPGQPDPGVEPDLDAPSPYDDSGFPISVDQPDGPAPNERELPDFQWPRILSVDLPSTPECGLTYPLIYTDLFQYMGSCDEIGPGVLGHHEQALLTRAREQAAVYCYRHRSPDCRGVNEVNYSFSHQCFQVDGETLVGVTINYSFECGGAAAGGEAGSGPPSVTQVPPPQHDPNCSSKYHYIAHSTTQILNDCNSPDRPAIEARKARRLLEAAQDHARGFCARNRNESCRIPVPLGHDISHHCFRSEPENAWFHTSTIIYLFQCPHTA